MNSNIDTSEILRIAKELASKFTGPLQPKGHGETKHAAFELSVYVTVMHSAVSRVPRTNEVLSWFLIEDCLMAANRLFGQDIPDSDFPAYIALMLELLDATGGIYPGSLDLGLGPISPTDVDYLGTPWSEGHPD